MRGDLTRSNAGRGRAEPYGFTTRAKRSRVTLVLVTTLAFAPGVPPKAGDFDDAQLAHIGDPAWFKESFLDLQEDINEARDAGKVGLMVLFTSEGFSYCAEFTPTSLADPRLAVRVQDHFDALVLDYLIGGDFERASFRDCVATRTANEAQRPAGYRLRPDPLFSAPPYALDRSRTPAQRPLLVIFEGEDCKDCASLHNAVLALSEVRDLLGRFEVVRLDAGDAATPLVAPDGTRTTPASWYEETGFSALPALLFFEEGGREVLRTDALVLR